MIAQISSLLIFIQSIRLIIHAFRWEHKDELGLSIKRRIPAAVIQRRGYWYRSAYTAPSGRERVSSYQPESANFSARAKVLSLSEASAERKRPSFPGQTLGGFPLRRKDQQNQLVEFLGYEQGTGRFRNRAVHRHILMIFRPAVDRLRRMGPEPQPDRVRFCKVEPLHADRSLKFGRAEQMGGVDAFDGNGSGFLVFAVLDAALQPLEDTVDFVGPAQKDEQPELHGSQNRQPYGPTLFYDAPLFPRRHTGSSDGAAYRLKAAAPSVPI